MFTLGATEQNLLNLLNHIINDSAFSVPYIQDRAWNDAVHELTLTSATVIIY